MHDEISILAGSNAIKKIREQGLEPDQIKVICGASGSAKFLVLTGIDRFLVQWFKGRTKPLHLIGTSIGAFRMAAFCQKDPVKAIDILEHEYIEQSYEKKPTRQDISEETKHIIDAFIDDKDIPAMLAHPFMRINFLSNRCKGLLKSENLRLQAMGIGVAAAINLVKRNLLGLCFERALFKSPETRSPFERMDQFPMKTYDLTSLNFKAALLSSGAIPMAMEGVSDITGVSGVFRDGGILDYHPDLPFLPEDDGLVLYPHFFETVTPGWFDKKLNRKPDAVHMRNVVLVAPSPKFVKTLPFGKIPDRKDFSAFKGNDRLRKAYWRIVAEKSRRLGHAFAETVDSGKIRSMVKPLMTDELTYPG